MLVCPTVSKFRFYECCHPCFIFVLSFDFRKKMCGIYELILAGSHIASGGYDAFIRDSRTYFVKIRLT